MSGFSDAWLTLRESADAVARSSVVLDRAKAFFSETPETGMLVCDLGAGTGASVDAFSHLFRVPLTWQLVDVDASNLALARTRRPRVGASHDIRVETKVHDLAKDPAPWSASACLVTATALFDLVSIPWLQEFTAALVRDRLALLATLTYDGSLELTPRHSLDDGMIDAFNAHQRTNKGFGPAAGPDASGVLESLVMRHGYEIVSGDSPWRLTIEKDRELILALLDGWAEAAREIGTIADVDVSRWLEWRKRETSTFVVGHRDIFAAPTG